ncbi:MAG: HAD family phosphatase [Verrucomicrobia bacterium]|nr:HAD family phosphatase [Verrucomicrobiota bacterium]
MIKAYCFDLDGTLIDSEVIWVEAIYGFLVDQVGRYPRKAAEEMVYGRSWHDIYQDIIRETPLTMPRDEMETHTKVYYQRIAATRDIRITASIDLLKRLAQTTPVCIVSGSSTKTVGEAIAKMAIEPQLQFYLGADDYSPGKPDPACYRLAAERLDLPPAACLVFEDSNAGVLAAKAAGMRCVALAYPGRPPQDYSAADLVLDDLWKFGARNF